MKRKTIYFLAGSIIITGFTGWRYYEHYLNDINTHQHGLGVKDMSCNDETMSSMELLQNNTTQWIKAHKDLLNSSLSIPTSDRRFKGNDVVPLTSILDTYKIITSVEVIPCDAETLQLNQIEASDDSIYLAQNKKGRMKLMKNNGKQKPATLLRNVIKINIITTNN